MNLVVVYQKNKNAVEYKYLCLSRNGGTTVFLTNELSKATLFTSISSLARVVTRAAQDPDLDTIYSKIIVYEVEVMKRSLMRTV